MSHFYRSALKISANLHFLLLPIAVVLIWMLSHYKMYSVFGYNRVFDWGIEVDRGSLVLFASDHMHEDGPMIAAIGKPYFSFPKPAETLLGKLELSDGRELFGPSVSAIIVSIPFYFLALCSLAPLAYVSLARAEQATDRKPDHVPS